jgi:catalase
VVAQPSVGGLSEQLYRALVADYPDHAQGTRPVHAVGIGAAGYFVPSDVASSYSKAEHFAGDRIPVTMRFSNGTGSPVERDRALDVRGLATKFHLPSGRDADLIMITLPQFFAATPKDFLGFAAAGDPKPDHGESWLRRLIDKLQLRQSAPPPDPEVPDDGTAGVLAYANRHMSARAGTVDALLLVTPTSYARVTYHALHVFKLTSADSTVRYARFTWEPVAGVRPLQGRAVPDDYLRTELAARLNRGPARFVLRMVLAGQGDPLDDPTKWWDTTRVRVVMGELVITDLAEDQGAGCERLSFNPGRAAPGFEGYEGDPILAARAQAYEYSCGLRGGSGCPMNGGVW